MLRTAKTITSLANVCALLNGAQIKSIADLSDSPAQLRTSAALPGCPSSAPAHDRLEKPLRSSWSSQLQRDRHETAPPLNLSSSFGGTGTIPGVMCLQPGADAFRRVCSTRKPGVGRQASQSGSSKDS